MKRRFANQVEGEYIQKRINEDYFKGYVCNIKIKDIDKPLIVNNGISEICIKMKIMNGLKFILIMPIMLLR